MTQLTEKPIRKKPRDPGAALVNLGAYPVRSPTKVFEEDDEEHAAPLPLTRPRTGRAIRDPGAALVNLGAYPVHSPTKVFDDELDEPPVRPNRAKARSSPERPQTDS